MCKGEGTAGAHRGFKWAIIYCWRIWALETSPLGENPAAPLRAAVTTGRSFNFSVPLPRGVPMRIKHM